MPHEIISHTDLIAFAHTQFHLGWKAKSSCWRNQAHCGAQWAILGDIKMPNQSTKRLGGAVLSYGHSIENAKQALETLQLGTNKYLLLGKLRSNITKGFECMPHEYKSHVSVLHSLRPRDLNDIRLQVVPNCRLEVSRCTHRLWANVDSCEDGLSPQRPGSLLARCSWQLSPLL